MLYKSSISQDNIKARFQIGKALNSFYFYLLVMIRCFKCVEYFYEWQRLADHLKLVHKLKYKSLYVCKFEDSCNRGLDNLRSFGNHVRSHFKRAVNRETVGASQNSTVQSTTISSPIESFSPSFSHCQIVTSSLFCENSPPSGNSSPIDNNSSSTFSKADALKFFLALHHLPNLTRKNVHDITSNVIENVVGSIISSVE